MPYSSESYLDFFDLDTTEDRIEDLRHEDVFRYRVKTFKCGKLLESEIFPLWRGQKTASRAKKKRKSSPSQENLNDKNAKKTLVRYVNNNFTEKDIWFTGTFDDLHLPKGDEEVHRFVLNYIRRIKHRRQKLKLQGGLRYVYVIEGRPEGSSDDDQVIRYHVHIILSGDMDRDEIEEMWSGGRRREAHRLQPDEFGLTGLAKYISKAPKKGRKRWGHSQNLKLPKPTVADHKISKRQAERIAENANAAPEVFERVYPGYRFLDIETKYSDFVPGAYIYARMRRWPDPPPGKKQKGGGRPDE